MYGMPAVGNEGWKQRMGVGRSFGVRNGKG